jgi:hypothetical protein
LGSNVPASPPANEDAAGLAQEFRATGYVRWWLQPVAFAIAAAVAVTGFLPVVRGKLLLLPTSTVLLLVAGLLLWNFCFSYPSRLTYTPEALFVRVLGIRVRIPWVDVQCVRRREASRAMGETCWLGMYGRAHDRACIITRRPLWAGKSLSFARHTMRDFDRLMELLERRLPGKTEPPPDDARPGEGKGAAP